MIKLNRPLYWANFASSLLVVLFAIMMTIAAAPASAESDKGEGSEDDRFFEIPPVSVSVVQNNRVVGYLSVSYKLMLIDLNSAGRISNMAPRLKDASVKILARIARTRLDVTKPLNIDLVHIYLQQTVDQVLGEGVAKVLIQDASLQPG